MYAGIAPPALGNAKSAMMKLSHDRQDDIPGNSVRDIGERMNGGAVNVDRSPVKVVILCTNTRRDEILKVGRATDRRHLLTS